MSSHVVRNTLVQARRGLSAQAATAKKSESVNAKVETSKLSNGLTVASIDTGAPISSVGVFVKAGSRNETYENRGVSQAVRLAAGLATKKHTSFSTVRNIQQAGGKVDVVSNRECTFYLSQAPRSGINEVADYALAMVDTPAFKAWEVYDAVPGRMAEEYANLSLADVATCLLHQAAYRDGLGNSLFAPQHMVGKHSAPMMQEFHSKHYTADKSVLVGLDIDHATLVALGEKLDLSKGGAGSLPSKYYGGEARQSGGGSHTCIAVAAEAPAWTNVKEAMAAMVLQQALGASGKVKYGSGQGILHKATANIGGTFAVSGLNIAYSDSALMGAFIASEADSAGKVLEAVVASLRSINITEEQLKAAKKCVQLSLHEQMLCPSSKFETLGSSILYGAKDGLTCSQVADACSGVTLSDVKAVAKKLGNAKFSMGAAGNLGDVPYIDQL